MQKTILVVEDNNTQMEMLKHLILEIDSNHLVYTAASAETAYKILMEITIDVFIMDIILDTSRPGDTSGIKMVEKIRTMPKYLFTPVIFITSLEDPEMYAYRSLHCFGYEEKPFDSFKVKKLIEEALQYTTCKSGDTTLYFRKDGVIYPIKSSDIMYIESHHHVVHMHLNNRTEFTVPYRTCKQIIEDADSPFLFQCSRSTIVNRNYIENVDLTNRYITIKDVGIRVDIGVTFLKKVLRIVKR